MYNILSLSHPLRYWNISTIDKKELLYNQIPSFMQCTGESLKIA